MKSLFVEKRKQWCDFLTKIDIRRSSKKVWNLIKSLDSNPKEKPKIPTITPNQIAYHLLVNAINKFPKPTHCKPKIIRTQNNDKHELGNTILFTELEDAIDKLKTGKKQYWIACSQNRLNNLAAP